MRKINYKSDFAAIVRFKNQRGEIINIPNFPFTLTFKTGDSWNTYVVSVFREKTPMPYFDGCRHHMPPPPPPPHNPRFRILNDTDLLVLFNSHNMGKGVLACQIKYDIPSNLMPDWEYNIYDPIIFDIELWDGASDCVQDETINILIPFAEAHSPYIGANGNWYEWDDEIGQFVDTGVKAKGDKNFYYTQDSASDEWHIKHNLNKYPSVTIIDSAGTQIIGAVEYNDINNITIYFASAFSGTATLN